MPSYQAIQSVLNFMWGKGAKLDIRTNLKDRSILVRIPNEYIRSKVLEKRIWYVGTSMFHVSQWCSSNSAPASLSIPTSIPLWAHLKGLPLDLRSLEGLPLDLRSLEGLTFAAGLIGKPKETDEFTRNLADLDLAHVKIEAVFSKPLPELIELRRTTGEIIPVEVSYPWVPPSCSNCRELGHIMKDCLHANPTWVEKDKPVSKVPEAAKNSTNINAVAAIKNPPTASAPVAADLSVSSPTPTASEAPPSSESVDLSFENDLQKILSLVPPSSQPPALPPPPPATASSPSPLDSLSIVTIPTDLDRRLTSFNHKSSLKRPSPLFPPALTLSHCLVLPKTKPLNFLKLLTPPTIRNSPFLRFSLLPPNRSLQSPLP
ncbi:unnamed protein product [Brassica oleracea]